MRESFVVRRPLCERACGSTRRLTFVDQPVGPGHRADGQTARKPASPNGRAYRWTARKRCSGTGAPSGRAEAWQEGCPYGRCHARIRLHALLGRGLTGTERRQVHELRSGDAEILRSIRAGVFQRLPREGVGHVQHLFADHLDRQREIEDFWLDKLGLPRSCLRLSTVNRYSKYSQKKRRNKLRYGTCRLSIYDTRLSQHIYGAIQEYAGFDRDEWLM